MENNGWRGRGLLDKLNLKNIIENKNKPKKSSV